MRAQPSLGAGPRPLTGATQQYHALRGGSFLCARQGALTSWLKSNAGPARGTASRTARVSAARPNPKEAVSKTLV